MHKYFFDNIHFPPIPPNSSIKLRFLIDEQKYLSICLNLFYKISSERNEKIYKQNSIKNLPRYELRYNCFLLLNITTNTKTR